MILFEILVVLICLPVLWFIDGIIWFDGQVRDAGGRIRNKKVDKWNRRVVWLRKMGLNETIDITGGWYKWRK